MEKLVLVHYWGDEGCSGTSHTAFEYESKDKFIFDVLEKFKDKVWQEFGGKHWKSHEEAEVFTDFRMNKFDVEAIEHNVFTLEEWFEKEKIIVQI